MSGRQLSLTGAGVVVDLEIVDGEFVASSPVDSLSALSPSPPPIPLPLEACNLFGEAERIGRSRGEREHAAAVRDDLPRFRRLARRRARPPAPR